MDISPWVNNQEDWLQPFVYACKLDFVHTSGGRTTAESGRIRARDPNNMVTWAQVFASTHGKGIIADTGYGVGGWSQGATPEGHTQCTATHRAPSLSAAPLMLCTCPSCAAHTGRDLNWEDAMNLEPRIRDGVVAITQVCRWNSGPRALLPVVTIQPCGHTER